MHYQVQSLAALLSNAELLTHAAESLGLNLPRDLVVEALPEICQLEDDRAFVNAYEKYGIRPVELASSFDTLLSRPRLVTYLATKQVDVRALDAWRKAIAMSTHRTINDALRRAPPSEECTLLLIKLVLAAGIKHFWEAILGLCKLHEPRFATKVLGVVNSHIAHICTPRVPHTPYTPATSAGNAPPSYEASVSQ
jgi:hypothetical protein